MIETEFGDIIEEGNGSVMKITDNAPAVLWDAINDAKSHLENSPDSFVLRAVGEPRRALDYGAGDVACIKTEPATLFTVKIDRGVKILSVGVSQEGYLSEEQVEMAFKELGKDASLTTTERLEAQSTSTALRSIRQSRNFLEENSRTLSDSVAFLEELLLDPSNNPDDIIDQAKTIEKDLHNLLSSVYTFKETVDSSLKELGLSAKYKHILQEFNDSTSTSIGLRHCIQHNMALRVRWIGSYSHSTGFFDYNIGVPLSHVDNPSLYEGKPADASGERHPPTEYYYGDIDGRIINLQLLNNNVRESTETAYEEIKSRLQEEELGSSSMMNKYMTALEWRAQEYHDE